MRVRRKTAWHRRTSEQMERAHGDVVLLQSQGGEGALYFNEQGVRWQELCGAE